MCEALKVRWQKKLQGATAEAEGGGGESSEDSSEDECAAVEMRARAGAHGQQVFRLWNPDADADADADAGDASAMRQQVLLQQDCCAFIANTFVLGGKLSNFFFQLCVQLDFSLFSKIANLSCSINIALLQNRE